jgi:adenylate cyclase class IV
MHKEIEVKILNIDRKDIRRKLKGLGAELVHKPVLLREVYFDSPARNHKFSSFRLRSGGGKTFLTIKFRTSDKKFNVADEYPEMNPYVEIEAASKKEVESFVKKLGYSFADTTNETATGVIKKAGLNPNKLVFQKIK